MSIGDFFRFLAEEHSVSSVVGSKFETATVSAEFVGIDLGVAIENVAKRVGAKVRFDQGVYYVGTLDKEDRGVLVRRVRRLGAEDIKKAVDAMLTEAGTAVAYADGLLVASDAIAVLDRVSSMLDNMEAVGASGWVVQLHVVAFDESAVDDFGLDVEPMARLALVANDSDVDVTVNAGIEAVLAASRDRSDVRTVATPLLLLGDGEKSSYDRIQRIPYRNEITDLFASQTRRAEVVDFLDVGFMIEISLREISQNQALLEMRLENSRIVEQAENLPPSTSSDRVECTIPVDTGGVYLAGSFEADRVDSANQIGLRKRLKRRSGREVYQVWVRAHRIGGPVPDAPGSAAHRREPAATEAGRDG